MSADEARLRVSEIFLSLQGEARDAGWPTVFLRLTGCPLRCSWCDTTYAFAGGELRSLEEVLSNVRELATGAAGRTVRHVCVTGGEPLAQRPCLSLLEQLCDDGFEVSLETSGALDVAAVDPRVVKVMDLKAPGSGEAKRNRWENIEWLTGRDQVKVVIADRDDYDWAVAVIDRYRLSERCEVLFSPCQGQLPPAELADWIVTDKLPVRFQLQLHKLLWGDARGR